MTYANQTHNHHLLKMLAIDTIRAKRAWLCVQVGYQ